MSWHLSGSRAWLMQRISAIYIALFLAFILITLTLGNAINSYEQWHSLWTSPAINLATLLFFSLLLLHAWVGMRDIILDYVTLFRARLLLLALLGIALLGCQLWAIRILIT
ncbi:MAG: succinate dehydrogenase, hydrophobic membrane anchor protein [Gammaproteobacteria bacterium]